MRKAPWLLITCANPPGAETFPSGLDLSTYRVSNLPLNQAVLYWDHQVKVVETSFMQTACFKHVSIAWLHAISEMKSSCRFFLLLISLPGSWWCCTVQQLQCANQLSGFFNCQLFLWSWINGPDRPVGVLEPCEGDDLPCWSTFLCSEKKRTVHRLTGPTTWPTNSSTVPDSYKAGSAGMCVSNYIKAIFTPYLVDVVDATLSIVLGWKTPKSFWFILQVHFSEGKKWLFGVFCE